nr:cellulose synthase [Tanacetum cinerariifolium]
MRLPVSGELSSNNFGCEKRPLQQHVSVMILTHVCSASRVSVQFPISTQPHGEQISSLHKRVHPYASPDYGSGRWNKKKAGGWKGRIEDWKM